MKIKVKKLDYDEVLKITKPAHKKPIKPNMFYRTLLKAVGTGDLKKTNFVCHKYDMDKVSPLEPVLFLMNHSSFIDLKIAANILYPRPFNIVCTSDGFVGKEQLMRNLGCIPTKKFISDLALVKDSMYCVQKLGSSILMYPEASYTFDGTATPLPEGFGKYVKLLGVPVVMIQTEGAFERDPLYNMLQLRDVDVSATMALILNKKDVEELSEDEIQNKINEWFAFDNFRRQQDKHIKVSESFRADGLNRVLYKCPCCQKEGKMIGKGIKLTCNSCGASWTLDEYGKLIPDKEEEKGFDHIPDWYAWERSCVRKELEEGTYKLDIPVTIRMMVDYNAIYEVGEGRLVHTNNGFDLTGCDGRLSYHHAPLQSYSLYSDYFWYELGDMICIGNQKALYYCFPHEDAGDIVAKTRLAAEELYKIVKQKA